MTKPQIPQKIHTISYSPEWEGKRLKQIVQEAFPELGSRSSMLVIKNGLISIAGGAAVEDADAAIPAGKNLQIDFRHGVHGEGKARRTPLLDSFRVIHDDNDVVVVAKNAFVLVQPTDDETLDKGILGEASLVELLKHYWKASRKPIISPILVQRLDLQTSGLMVLAKNVNAARDLQDQLKPPRELRREYFAYVAGEMIADSGTWKSQLGRGRGCMRQTVADEDRNPPPGVDSQLAITHFVTVRRFANASLLRVRLETGRTHQIRIHSAEAGHPVLGDTLYQRLGKNTLDRAAHQRISTRSPWHPSQEAMALVQAGRITLTMPQRLPKRVALHATELSFNHPVTRERLTFNEPIPRELEEYQRYLEKQKRIT